MYPRWWGWDSELSMSASIAWALDSVLNSSLQREYFSDTENSLEVTSGGGGGAGGGRERDREGGRGYIEVGRRYRLLGIR